MSQVTPEMLRAAQTQSELGSYVCANWAGAYDVIMELYDVMDSAREKTGSAVDQLDRGVCKACCGTGFRNAGSGVIGTWPCEVCKKST